MLPSLVARDLVGCSLDKKQADKFGINYGMGNPNGAKELLKKVDDK